MAKMYFYYSAMNAGKSSHLLQSSFNYRERGMKTLIFNANLDSRFGEGVVASRIGLSEPAILFDDCMDFEEVVKDKVLDEGKISCVLIDEAQFLTSKQVDELARIVDFMKIPVLTYGLRTDFSGKLFEGSQQLLAKADELSELKGMCACGKKATMVLRTDDDKNVIKSGGQIEIGGNEQYVSVCRMHHTISMDKGIVVDGSAPEIVEKQSMASAVAARWASLFRKKVIS